MPTANAVVLASAYANANAYAPQGVTTETET